MNYLRKSAFIALVSMLLSGEQLGPTVTALNDRKNTLLRKYFNNTVDFKKDTVNTIQLLLFFTFVTIRRVFVSVITSSVEI